MLKSILRAILNLATAPRESFAIKKVRALSARENITKRLWTFFLTSAETVRKWIHYPAQTPVKPLTQTVLSSTWCLKPRSAPFHLHSDTNKKGHLPFVYWCCLISISGWWALILSWISTATSPDRYLISFCAVGPILLQSAIFFMSIMGNPADLVYEVKLWNVSASHSHWLMDAP